MKIELTFTGDGRYQCDGLPEAFRILGDGLPPGRSPCQSCPRFTYCPLSHVAAVLAEIDNLDALEAACKELGLTFVHGQKTFKWFGEWVGDYNAQDAAFKHGIDPKDYGKCAHAIKVPGSTYEIGVKQMPNGKYKLVYDFYGTGRKIVNTLGKGCEKLVQHYGLNRATLLGRAKGLITQRKVTQTLRKVEGLATLNPDIKLVITGIK